MTFEIEKSGENYKNGLLCDTYNIIKDGRVVVPDLIYAFIEPDGDKPFARFDYYYKGTLYTKIAVIDEVSTEIVNLFKSVKGAQ